MGIKGLTQFLKRHDIDYVSLIPLENFSGKKIAIDAPLFVCVFKMRNNFVESIVEFLTTLREHNIHPFFVFDGVAPIEKSHERHERALKRLSVRTKIETLERDLEEFKSSGHVSALLLTIRDDVTRSLYPSKLSEVKIRNYIDKLKSQILNLTPEDFETMKDILNTFAVPFATAQGEAEIYCSALNRRGLVEAVMTPDSDALASLAPQVITKIETLSGGKYFSVTHLDKLLEGLKLTEESFRDFCIMCGTDFNSNIPKIACVKAFDLISVHKTIDSLPSEHDISCLNHERIREIFGFSIPEGQEPNIPYSGRIDYDKLARTTPNWESVKYRTRPKKIVMPNKNSP